MYAGWPLSVVGFEPWQIRPLQARSAALAHLSLDTSSSALQVSPNAVA